MESMNVCTDAESKYASIYILYLFVSIKTNQIMKCINKHKNKDNINAKNKNFDNFQHIDNTIYELLHIHRNFLDRRDDGKVCIVRYDKLRQRYQLNSVLNRV